MRVHCPAGGVRDRPSHGSRVKNPSTMWCQTFGVLFPLEHHHGGLPALDLWIEGLTTFQHLPMGERRQD